MATIMTTLERLAGNLEFELGELTSSVRTLLAEIRREDPPPPEPEPEPGPLPSGDYPRGTLRGLIDLSARRGFGEWSKRVVAPDRIQVVTQDSRPAFRVEVRPGDSPSNAERSELYHNPKGDVPHGAIWYLACSFWFPASWKNSAGYQIVHQMHGVGDSLSPALSLRATARGLVLRCRGGADDNTKKDIVVSDGLANGEWLDVLMFGVSGDTPQTGRVAVWSRAQGQAWEQQCDERIETAANHRNGQYPRMGLYRGGSSQTDILWNGGCALGNSFAEVAGAMWPE